MANLLQNKPDSDLNPGDADYRRKTNFDDELKELNRSEADGNLEKDYGKELESDPGINDAQKELEKKENNPDFVSTYGQNKSSSSKSKSGSRLSGLKKGGPTGLIITLALGGTIGVGGFFAGPSLLIEQIYEKVTGDPRINTQLTSFASRTSKMLSSKFGSTGSTCSSATSIICKETHPSNFQLQEMDEEGITVKDAAGNAMTGESTTPNTDSPETVDFTDDSGTPEHFGTTDIAEEVGNNAELRSEFDKSFNTRFVSLADSVFSGIKARFGFTGSDPIKDDDPTKIDDTIDNEAVGENSEGNTSTSTGSEGSSKENDPVNTALEGGDAPAGVIANASTSEIAADLEQNIEGSLQSVGEDGEKDASGVSIATGVACAAADVPGMLVKMVRAYQLAQVIRYASVFLVVAGALRAGDATPAEMAALGSLLTVVITSTGNSSPMSAMDSFGMRSLLFGDTAAGLDKSWFNFSPGANIAKSGLGQVASIFSSSVKTDFCAVATSPLTQDSIDTGLDGTVVGGVVNTILGIGGGFALSQFAGPIAQSIASLIPATAYETILGDIAGNSITGLAGGSGTGDALASGAENMMSQTANAGGNMPLTVNQAVAYNQVTDQVALQYAQDDRATLSPLDASNPNTALGSFVNQFMPYYGDLSSVSGIFSMLGSVVGSTFGTILNPVIAQAADPTAQFTQCQDPSITGSGTAATPFCAIDYGIPAQYLNISPTKVANDLIASGDIDADGNVLDNKSATADTVSSVFGVQPSVTTSLSGWMKQCSDGSTSQIIDNTTNNCTINSEQTAEYALYTVDHRIQQTMDGEDTNVTTGVPTSTGSTGSTGATSASTDTSTSSAYNSTSNNNQLLALLDSFNQPEPTIPHLPSSTTQSETIKPVSADMKNLFVAALPQRRYTGITA